MELDTYQKNAYLTKEKKVLVVAPPGSGKTTVMLKRLKLLLEEEKIAPRKIIVLTFSKASAVEMETRFSAKGPVKPFFGTIHGLCYRILRGQRRELNLIYGKEEFILKNKLKKQLKIEEEVVESILRSISKYKVMNFLSLPLPELGVREELFHKAFELYEEERQKKNLLDFDDLQIEVLKLLSEETFLRSFQAAHSHILIDEFQDLDPVQLKIVELMSKDQSLFCVGDEDQCIYAFRGSDPRGMIDFEPMFQGKKLYLKYNYRSKENIVQYAGEVIRHNAQRNNKELLSSRKEETKILKVFPENQELMLQHIVSEIKKDAYSSYAVLYRTNQEGLRVKEYLRKEKIPFMSRDAYNFFKGFIAKDVLDFIRASCQGDREAFLRIANKPFRYISKEELRKISLGEDLERVLLDPKKKNYTLQKHGEFLKDLSKLKGMKTERMISYIEQVLGYGEYLLSYAEKTGRDEEALLEELEEMKEVAAYYDNPLDLLAASEKEPEVKEAKVSLSTIHGVKGLEFDKVYVINAVEGFMPHSASLGNLEEERRIFYVAITRAKEELTIYSPRFIHGKERKRSRFVL